MSRKPVWKIRPDGERDFVESGLHGSVGEQWLVGAAVGVGNGLGEERALAVGNEVKCDDDAGAGFPLRWCRAHGW